MVRCVRKARSSRGVQAEATVTEAGAINSSNESITIGWRISWCRLTRWFLVHLKWPNKDDIYHNVFSMSDKKEFNLGLYGKEKTPLIVFDQVGRVDVFCSIHTKMHCIILVLPSAYFSMADARGRYVIKDVPAGTYRIKAWQERMPPLVKEVVVPAEGEVKLDFVLGLSELPSS